MSIEPSVTLHAWLARVAIACTLTPLLVSASAQASGGEKANSSQSSVFERSSPGNDATDHALAGVNAPQGLRLAQLGDIAWRDGSVAVIARLRVDLDQEFDGSRASLDARMAKIAVAQDSVSSSILDSRGSEIERFASVTPYIALHVDEAMLHELAMHPDVEAVYADELMEPDLADTTELVNASDVWLNHDLQLRGEGTKIAILDSGIEADHGFLYGKVVHGECFGTNSSRRDPTDGELRVKSESLCTLHQEHEVGWYAGWACPWTLDNCDHGTKVAGVVSGSNHLMAGVAPRAEIMSFKVVSRVFGLDCDLGHVCIMAFTSDVISAMAHLYVRVMYQGLELDAINVSLSAKNTFYEHSCDSHPYNDIINLLASANVATVASSGNEGIKNGLPAPACVNNAIAVGGTRKTDVVYGRSNSAYYMDLLAPGYSITTSSTFNTYKKASGTSFAAPHVAGAFLLARQRFPNASVRTLLQGFWDYGKLLKDPVSGTYTTRIDLSWLIDTDPEDEYCDRTPLWVFDSNQPIPRGNLEFRGDQDWATIRHFPQFGQELRVQLDPPANRDYRIEVWNQHCSALIASSDVVGNGETETVDLSGYPSGVYKVRVVGSDDSQYDGEYQLSTHYLRDGQVCGAPEWALSNAYHAGDKVSFGGQEYVAWYWSQGTNPEANHGVQSSGLPWGLPTACTCVPDCANSECGLDGCGGVCGVCDQGYICADDETCQSPEPCESPAWLPEQSYVAGDRVSFDGFEFTAWHWTKNQDPLVNHGPQSSGRPWQQGRACSE